MSSLPPKHNNHARSYAASMDGFTSMTTTHATDLRQQQQQQLDDDDGEDNTNYCCTHVDSSAVERATTTTCNNDGGDAVAVDPNDPSRCHDSSSTYNSTARISLPKTGGSSNDDTVSSALAAVAAVDSVALAPAAITTITGNNNDISIVEIKRAMATAAANNIDATTGVNKATEDQVQQHTNKTTHDPLQRTTTREENNTAGIVPGAVHVQPTNVTSSSALPLSLQIMATAQPVLLESNPTNATTTNLDAERDAIIREARQNFVAQVSHAEPIDLDLQESNNRKMFSNYCYFGFALILLIGGVTVYGIVVSADRRSQQNRQQPPPFSSSPTIAPTATPALYNERGQRVFLSTQQLYDAVDAYQAQLEGDRDNVKISDIAVEYGYPIGTWDVSRLTDFSRVFDPARHERLDVEREPRKESTFDEDLSGWNMSSAVTISGMFAGATSFTGKGIDSWDVRRVVDFSFTFAQALRFNGNISAWDTSNGKTMKGMFLGTLVSNGDVSQFGTSNVENMDHMFDWAYRFEGRSGLNRWNVSNVVTMRSMFSGTPVFTGNVSAWDTSRVTNMDQMFASSFLFNDNLSNWSVAKVTTMSEMLNEAHSYVGGDLTRWNTSGVTYMNKMFYLAVAFNGTISAWDVSRVMYMQDMFRTASSFDGDLSRWNTSSVVDMSRMFYDAVTFSGDISLWDTSNVELAIQMFHNTDHFNSDVSLWNVSRLRDATEMFYDAEAFNHSLCLWGNQLSPNALVDNMFNDSACINWSDPNFNQPTIPGPFCTPCSR